MQSTIKSTQIAKENKTNTEQNTTIKAIDTSNSLEFLKLSN